LVGRCNPLDAITGTAAVTGGFDWAEYNLQWLVVLGMVTFVSPLAYTAYEIIIGKVERDEDVSTKRFGGK
jgi:hypothetical protein